MVLYQIFGIDIYFGIDIIGILCLKKALQRYKNL